MVDFVSAGSGLVGLAGAGADPDLAVVEAVAATGFGLA